MITTWAIANEVASAVIWSTVAPIEPRICGRATLTMDRSMVAIRAPSDTAAATSHLLSGWRRSSAGSGHAPVATASLIALPFMPAIAARWRGPVWHGGPDRAASIPAGPWAAPPATHRVRDRTRARRAAGGDFARTARTTMVL